MSVEASIGILKDILLYLLIIPVCLMFITYIFLEFILKIPFSKMLAVILGIIIIILAYIIFFPEIIKKIMGL
jgi:hypothetical protein